MQFSNQALSLLQLRGYFSRLRKAAGFIPGENPFPIGDDVKDTISTGNQPGVYSQRPVQFIRQTGGFFQEFSRPAIVDYYFHYTPSIIKKF